MSAYDDLMNYNRVTQALASVNGRTGWDQETMMPEGAGALRAEEMSALETVLHERRTSPKVGDWLDRADPSDDVAQANVRHIKREYERHTRVPADLAAAIAGHCSRAQRIWADARAEDDVTAFLPTLSEMISLKREEAAAVSQGGDVYDALLADYEPGITGGELQTLFDNMRPRIVALRARALNAQRPEPLDREFDETLQMQVSTVLAKAFGYDMSIGRIDKAVHPFSSGSGTDVRITTRTSARDPFNCF
ncbi:MAG: carboxypeptidase M32, partial [Litoreibacter sp.]